VERKKQPQVPGEEAPTAPPEDGEEPEEDEIVEDFEMKLSKEVLASVAAGSRTKMIAAAARTVARLRAEEEKKLIAALAKLGVDWSAPPAGANAAPSANLEVAVTSSIPGPVKAGTELAITATVRN